LRTTSSPPQAKPVCLQLYPRSWRPANLQAVGSIRRRRPLEDRHANGAIEEIHGIQLLEYNPSDDTEPNTPSSTRPPRPPGLGPPPADLADDPFKATIIRLTQILRLPDRKSLTTFALDQSSLWAMSILFTALSGVMMGFALVQTRPPACIPRASDYDDGFWVLLSQLCLQLLSLYVTVVPLLRNYNFPVRRFWFGIAVGTSLIMEVLSLALYGVSWKVSAISTYVAAVASLITDALLTGAIHHMMHEPNLGRSS
jgi:hypothetical protein